MATPKSPFYVVQNFISPKQCEMIVDDLGYYSPDLDPEGKPIKMMRHHEPSEKIIYEKFKSLIPKLEAYYDFEHRGTEHITFEYMAAGVKPEPVCDSSKWIKKKWVRTKDRDFSAVLFLSDYQEDVPFDSEYEVYGGKLEFLQHKFGFNPQRGTLIVYPSSPHFINAFSEIFVGDLYVARFYIASQMPYLYQPDEFPGNYLSWFGHLE
jgi:hypothetical protein